MLLLYLGLPLDTKLTDFVDGELKTNKTDSKGDSKETIFITQILSIIDELIDDTPKSFWTSNLFPFTIPEMLHIIFNLINFFKYRISNTKLC